MPARRTWVVLALVGCGSSASPTPPEPVAIPVPPAAVTTPKPPDEMDERMRHCPLALDGAKTTLENIATGVRFTIQVPEPVVAEVRRRAHHIVEFAARKTRAGHGGFDGKGGGRMKNCPVVTDQVTIAVTEVAGGARLEVSAIGDVAALRTESRARAERFPFAGAQIVANP